MTHCFILLMLPALRLVKSLKAVDNTAFKTLHELVTNAGYLMLFLELYY